MSFMNSWKYFAALIQWRELYATGWTIVLERLER